MKIADITMTGEILKLHSGQPTAVLTVTHKLRLGNSLFLVNDDCTAYVNYDPVFGGKWVAHIASMPEVRGSRMWGFALGTAVWMIENRNLSHLLCFVKDDDRRLKTFVRIFTMKDMGKIGDEVLYFADAQQILDFDSQNGKEVESCQQH